MQQDDMKACILGYLSSESCIAHLTFFGAFQFSYIAVHCTYALRLFVPCNSARKEDSQCIYVITQAGSVPSLDSKTFQVI